MNNEENKQSISEIVAAKIKSGEIKMKPKFYFAFKIFLLAAGLFLLTFAALFLVSFIMFYLRVNGIFASPAANFWGLRVLFSSLPWVLILLVVLLIATSEIFAKHFSFVYRKPVLYSVLAIILIILVGGFIIDRTNFHLNLFLKARSGNLIFAGPIYRDFGMPEPRGLHYGVVTEIIENGLKITNPRGKQMKVTIDSKTRLPDKEINVGDALFIMGEIDGDTIEAFDIKIANKDKNLFEERMIIKFQLYDDSSRVKKIQIFTN